MSFLTPDATNNQRERDAKKAFQRQTHYYGDTVRTLFLLGGAVMIFSLPFFAPLLNMPVALSLLAIVALAIVAGLASPRQKWVAMVNSLAAAIAVVVFEYFALDVYSSSGLEGMAFVFFVVNQGLAIIFFLALYYSTKTLRGLFLNGFRQ